MPRAEAAAPVCDLGALGGARGRHHRLLATMLAGAVAVEEAANGWRLELPAEPRLFRAAAAWVGLERRCCSFVGFRLRWTRRGRVLLEAEAGEAGRAALKAGLAAVVAAGAEPLR